jgi:hypothetical protein
MIMMQALGDSQRRCLAGHASTATGREQPVDQLTI